MMWIFLSNMYAVEVQHARTSGAPFVYNDANQKGVRNGQAIANDTFDKSRYDVLDGDSDIVTFRTKQESNAAISHVQQNPSEVQYYAKDDECAKPRKFYMDGDSEFETSSTAEKSNTQNEDQGSERKVQTDTEKDNCVQGHMSVTPCKRPFFAFFSRAHKPQKEKQVAKQQKTKGWQLIRRINRRLRAIFGIKKHYKKAKKAKEEEATELISRYSSDQQSDVCTRSNNYESVRYTDVIYRRQDSKQIDDVKKMNSLQQAILTIGKYYANIKKKH